MLGDAVIVGVGVVVTGGVTVGEADCPSEIEAEEVAVMEDVELEEAVVVCDAEMLDVCVDEVVIDAVDELVIERVADDELVSDAVWLAVAVWLDVCDDVTLDVGVGSTVAVFQPAPCGGIATPRNTEPAGAVASCVFTLASVSYEYSVLLVQAYRMNEPPGVVCPVME